MATEKEADMSIINIPLLTKTTLMSIITTTQRSHHQNILLPTMGRGLTSGGQESGSVFSAAVCKIQANKLTLSPYS